MTLTHWRGNRKRSTLTSLPCKGSLLPKTNHTSEDSEVHDVIHTGQPPGTEIRVGKDGKWISRGNSRHIQQLTNSSHWFPDLRRKGQCGAREDPRAFLCKNNILEVVSIIVNCNFGDSYHILISPSGLACAEGGYILEDVNGLSQV